VLGVRKFRKIGGANGRRAKADIGKARTSVIVAYSDKYPIDVTFGVIVDVEASRSIRQAEVGAAKTMIERTEELRPQAKAADPFG
jgi:hypothetical protein